jgi:ABC-type Fe3+-hydroxamate transport system substrate-binding protein
MKQKTLMLILSLIATLVFTGCSSDDSSAAKAATTPNPVGDPPGPTNNTPASIVGKTYALTVTANQNLTEPVGATYSLIFGDATYTFNPSPQNLEQRTTPIQGTYTYDPGTATVVLTGNVEDVTGTWNFTSPRSGTVHWSELDGEMQDANFAEL